MKTGKYVEYRLWVSVQGEWHDVGSFTNRSAAYIALAKWLEYNGATQFSVKLDSKNI